MPASHSEGPAASLVDSQALLHIRIHKPLQVLDNPWLQEVWGKLSSSPTIQQQVEGWQSGRLTEMRQFLERASGESWRSGLEKLTAGGIEFALQKRPVSADSKNPGQQPYAALLVIHSSDGRLLRKFLAAADQERREKLGEQAGLLDKKSQSQKYPKKDRGTPNFSNYTYRKHSCTKVVKGHDRPGEYFAAVGRRFLFTTDEKLLEELINRCSDKADATAGHVSPGDASGPKEAVVASSATATQPLLSFSVRLDQLREIPQFRDLLLPTAEPWMAPFVAYRDSLRREKRLDGAVLIESGAVQVRLTSSTEAGEVAASSPKTPSANASGVPLLRLPNTGTSVRLDRDVAQLWRDRKEWLTTDGIQQVEEWNRLASAQIAGLDLLRSLDYIGSQWRIVMTVPPPLTEEERARFRAEFEKMRAERAKGEPRKAESRKSESGKGDRERGRRGNRFPAGALAVNLRDESAFRREVLERVENYFQTPAASAIGKLETVEYHGTRIITLRLNPPPVPPEASRGAAHTEESRREAGDQSPRRSGGHPGGPHFARNSGNRGFSMFRFFHYSCAIRNGQLLVGTNAEILRQMIDELGRLSTTPATDLPAYSAGSEQFLSLAKVADHIRSVNRILQWRLTKSGGWNEDQAKQELSAWEGVLRQLGDVTWQETASDKSLQLDLRLGKPTP